MPSPLGSFFGGAILVANLADGTGVTTLAGSEGGSGPNFPVLLRAPTGTGVPTISGGGVVGEELACSQGSWAADLLGAFLYRAPRSFAYQWQKDGDDILGADETTFTPTQPGSYTCRVTAENQAGSTAQTSAPTVVTEPTPTPTVTPVPPTPTWTPTVTPVLCGNSNVDTAAGEQCDDGNTINGACCDSTCHFEPAGQSCNDHSTCTTGETCNAAGLCRGFTACNTTLTCNICGSKCTLQASVCKCG